MRRLAAVDFSKAGKILQGTPLFQGIDGENLDRILQERGNTVAEYEKGERISSAEYYDSAIGIILEGRAKIIKQAADDHEIIMNFLLPGRPFGVAEAFCRGNRELSIIIAMECCKVLFLPRELLLCLLESIPAFAVNYICFLSDRVHFLNRKIEGFTGYNAKSKLEMYLLDHVQSTKEGEMVELTCSLSALADVLNVGRASLYRALDLLEENKVISRSGKRIKILDITQLYAVEEKHER